MKLMIASDIHGDADCCLLLKEAFEKENADKLLLLGDLLYHGPRNDLPSGYAPKKVIEILSGMKQALCFLHLKSFAWVKMQLKWGVL